MYLMVSVKKKVRKIKTIQICCKQKWKQLSRGKSEGTNERAAPGHMLATQQGPTHTHTHTLIWPTPNKEKVYRLTFFFF